MKSNKKLNEKIEILLEMNLDSKSQNSFFLVQLNK